MRTGLQIDDAGLVGVDVDRDAEFGVLGQGCPVAGEQRVQVGLGADRTGTVTY